jgi:3-hydroxyisobutyrate/3-hydroxypropionate dehydrogenase
MMGAPNPTKALRPSNSAIPIDAKISARLQTVVSYMANPEKMFYCGTLGHGLAAKLSNNYLSVCTNLMNAEAMALGVKLGLDPHLLYRIVQASSGQNWMMEHVCPVPGVVPYAPSSNGYKLGFKASMLTKDVGLAAEAMKKVGIEPTIGEAAMRVYRDVAADERYQVSRKRPC